MNSDEARQRAEQNFKKEDCARDTQKAVAEYEARALAIREKTERLKALRLAKQAQEQKSKRALEAPVDAVYGAIRAGLERAGKSIGSNDLLIAAHALTLGHAVVTDNEREFLRIDDLQVENWLR